MPPKTSVSVLIAAKGNDSVLTRNLSARRYYTAIPKPFSRPQLGCLGWGGGRKGGGRGCVGSTRQVGIFPTFPVSIPHAYKLVADGNPARCWPSASSTLRHLWMDRQIRQIWRLWSRHFLASLSLHPTDYWNCHSYQDDFSTYSISSSKEAFFNQEGQEGIGISHSELPFSCLPNRLSLLRRSLLSLR